MANPKKVEALIYKLVNSSRKKHKLSSFKRNKGLDIVARKHSFKMARVHKIWHGDGVYLAKSNIKYNGFFDFILSLFSNGTSGENVALMPLGNVIGIKGKIRTSKDVAFHLHNSWMKSPGHRQNILNSNFDKIGIGVCYKNHKFYATELFYG